MIIPQVLNGLLWSFSGKGVIFPEGDREGGAAPSADEDERYL